MRRPSGIRLIVKVIVIGLCATVFKLVLILLSDKDRLAPARSSAEAKSRGVLISRLTPDPAEIPWRGDKVEIGDTWAELEAEEKRFLVWWTYYKPTRKSHFVILTLNKDVSRLPSFNRMTFGIYQKGHEGFVPMVDEEPHNGRTRYWALIDNLEAPDGMTLVIYRPNSSEEHLKIHLRR